MCESSGNVSSTMVLVTGATGHVGRAVVSRLASLGHAGGLRTSVDAQLRLPRLRFDVRFVELRIPQTSDAPDRASRLYRFQRERAPFGTPRPSSMPGPPLCSPKRCATNKACSSLHPAP